MTNREERRTNARVNRRKGDLNRKRWHKAKSKMGTKQYQEKIRIGTDNLNILLERFYKTVTPSESRKKGKK